jgi:hypothetical protein
MLASSVGRERPILSNTHIWGHPWGPRDISVTTAHSLTVSLVSDTDNDSCNDSELTYNLILVLVSHTICVSSLGDGDVLTTALGQPCLASPCLEYCKSLFFLRNAFGGYEPYFRVWFFVMSSPHSSFLLRSSACLRRSQDHKSSISCGRESTTSESSSVTILYDDCRGAGAAVVPQRSRTAFRCCRLARALVRPSSLCEGPALALIQAAARCECVSSLCWAAGAAEVGLRTHQQHFPSLA